MLKYDSHSRQVCVCFAFMIQGSKHGRVTCDSETGNSFCYLQLGEKLSHAMSMLCIETVEGNLVGVE